MSHVTVNKTQEVEIHDRFEDIEELDRRTRHAREMVHDLELFLSRALARPTAEAGHYPWPLRYNSQVAGGGRRHTNEA
ncbi:MAG TPA: hypothetical protein VL992_02580 [Tepidisphaeraceae bacterium]|nr:hypothetical protein [Tepidisphaeraceae bacterium]